MVRVDEAAVVKYDKGDGHFEVLADPDLVLDIRKGKDVPVEKALAIVQIFRDAGKAKKAGAGDLERAFGTDDPLAAAEEIIKKGEFHLTTRQKKEMVEERRNQVIQQITVNSVDPRSNLPHTRERVERAIEKAGVHIDMRPVSEQIDEVVDAIRPILPIRFGKTTLEVIVPAEYAPSLYGKLKGMGKLKDEKWLANGSLQVHLQVPSGAKVDVMDKLGGATKGDAIIKEVK